LVKKVTIITPPEYESLILESLGGSGVIQLKEVSGPDLEWLSKGSERVTDYAALYQKIHPRYIELSELTDSELEFTRTNLEEFRRFTEDPETEAEAILKKLEELIEQTQVLKETQDNEMKRVVDELQTEITSLKNELTQSEEETTSKIEGQKARPIR
jgi:vacuolar-type H+-ATPase subunit I/STV1